MSSKAGKLLLIVDDEPSLLDLMDRYLSRRGYGIRTAATATLALTAFLKSPHAFAGVVVDLTLPDMGGEELLERLRALRAELPAVICSGGLPAPADRANTVFLQKPFLPRMLAAAVEGLLEQPPTARGSV